jgi:hypothetical protein
MAAKYAAGASAQELGRQYGCSAWLVRRAVKRCGGTVLERGQQPRKFSPIEVEDMALSWRNGDSQFAIAQRLGVSQTVISRVLRTAGYEKQKRLPVGEKHGMWKGGRTQTDQGYWQVLLQPSDPFASMRSRAGYVLEHRLVMARSLGRALSRTETVHHINGKRDDNRLENLQLRQGQHGKGTTMHCKDCGSHNIEAVRLTED